MGEQCSSEDSHAEILRDEDSEFLERKLPGPQKHEEKKGGGAVKSRVKV